MKIIIKEAVSRKLAGMAARLDMKLYVAIAKTLLTIPVYILYFYNE